jgi:hypothetical protein
MRKLYFDIDGTILDLQTASAKPALLRGKFVRAVRAAGIEQLVCVGNYAGVVVEVQAKLKDYDALGAILELCGGVFTDEAWFRENTRLICDPERRAGEVDLDSDWWYLDDLAEKYFTEAGRAEVFRQQLGRRILAPAPEGDGEDVLDWLRAIGRPSP